VVVVAEVEKIGNPHGRIALYLDYDEAMDLAQKYPYPDTGGIELVEAATRAYPERVAAEEGCQ
jgi:hypothetical protein